MLIEKINLEKTDKAYYKAKLEPTVINIEAHDYLTIQGKSDPNDPDFLAAVETIYGVAYGIKFIAKSEDLDFTVPKMEGYWWIDGCIENQAEFVNVPRDEWNWKIVIRMPEFIGKKHFERAIAQVRSKKSPKNLERLSFESMEEGLCAQVLHIGSYENEGPSIDKLHQFMNEEGLKIRGYHHEIYISDPRRTAPDKLKTILRYEVA